MKTISNKIKPASLSILLTLLIISLPVSGADLTAESLVPRVNFEHEGNEGHDWRLQALNGLDPLDSDFSLYSQFSNEEKLTINEATNMKIEMNTHLFNIHGVNSGIIQIDEDAPSQSLRMFNSGLISLGDGALRIDTDNGRVGIGTSTPGADLEINSSAPGILFNDIIGSSADWAVSENGGDLAFTILSNGTGGPVFANILNLDAQTGFIGMGTTVPAARLHVAHNDEAKVLVENTTGTRAPRTLFELKNPGNTKFTVNNTDAGVEWSFANPGTGFRLSRQGSGFVEFEVFNNGDAELHGALTENSDVNAKQDIEAIDSANILEKVVSLPVSQWRYKDAPETRHIGPMAQDFYAAFGLGNTDKGIASIDTGGVALAAIQALAKQNAAQADENVQLRAQNLSLEQRLHELEGLVMRLARQQTGARQVAMH